MLAVSLFALLWTSAVALDSINYGEPSQVDGLTMAEKQHLLDLHNKYRQLTAQGSFFNKPPAANMMKMSWNASEAKAAQEWANNCAGKAHNRAGQNYAASYPPSRIFYSAFNGWNDREAKLWTTWTTTEGDGKDWWDQNAGHFSQVVWAASVSVGCGFNSCPGHMARLICNYYPNGNFGGRAPYTTGKACSKCPEGSQCVDNALCTAPTTDKPTCANESTDEECEALKDYCESKTLQDWCKKTCGKC